MKYIDLLKIKAEKRREYIENIEVYFKKIAGYFKEKLREAKVYVYGSFLEGRFGITSDIDILVVSPNTPADISERARLIWEILDTFGDYHPFEIHLVSPEVYNEWYSHFIKLKREL